MKHNKKVTQYMLAITACLLFFNVSFAMDGISKDDLKKLFLRSGIASIEDVLPKKERAKYDRMVHKQMFANTLGKIEDAAKEFSSEDSTKERIDHIKSLLPKSLQKDEIAALALITNLSPEDDAGSKAKKFIRLALLIRDMYQAENPLGLFVPVEYRMSEEEIMSHVVTSFSKAESYLKKAGQNISIDREIDLKLSLAQVLLWKLTYTLKYPASDYEVYKLNESSALINMNACDLVIKIREILKQVKQLINNPKAKLPTLYEGSIIDIAKRLSDSERYDLIKMHKAQLDQKRQSEPNNVFDELSQARGLLHQANNPLDYFTEERVHKLEDSALNNGIPIDKLDRFVESVKMNYCLQKLPKPHRYLPQEIIQRYLEETGKVSREKFAGVILEKINSIEYKTDLLASTAIIKLSLPIF